MNTLLLPFERRYLPLRVTVMITVVLLVVVQFWAGLWLLFVPMAALSIVGLRDLTQPSHSILRNYPIAAHARFFLEKIRPEIRQVSRRRIRIGSARSLSMTRPSGSSDSINRH